MKKIMLGFFVFLTALSLTFAGSNKFRMYYFGGLNYTFEYGSAEDYQFGGNDFPVTPAHSTLNIGMSFSYFLTK